MSLALGLLFISSKDILLEYAHFLSHTNDYVTKSVRIHSHKIGNKTIVHHDHRVLSKIDDVTKKVEKHKPANQQNDQYLTFDQIKLILADTGIVIHDYNLTELFSPHVLRQDQFYQQFPSPPPQRFTV